VAVLFRKPKQNTQLLQNISDMNELNVVRGDSVRNPY